MCFLCDWMSSLNYVNCLSRYMYNSLILVEKRREGTQDQQLCLLLLRFTFSLFILLGYCYTHHHFSPTFLSIFWERRILGEYDGLAHRLGLGVPSTVVGLSLGRGVGVVGEGASVLFHVIFFVGVSVWNCFPKSIFWSPCFFFYLGLASCVTEYLIVNNHPPNEFLAILGDLALDIYMVSEL